MSFENTIQILETFAYNSEVYSLFDHNQVEYFRESISYMRDFVKRAVSESDIQPLLEKEDGLSSIKFTLSTISRHFVLTSFDEMKYSIVYEYTLLVENFIKASENYDPSIQEELIFLQVLLSYHHSLVGAIEILRKLISEGQGFMDFKPPAFELSKHYLQSIDERIKGRR